MTEEQGRPAGGQPAEAAGHRERARSDHTTVVETTSQQRRRDTIRAEAADVARSLPTDELAALADALRAETEHWRTLPGLDEESRAVALVLACERLVAAETELARRERLAAIGICRSPSRDADYAAWRRLAEEVRRRLDCRDLLLRELGWHPARQTEREAAGPCPLCGGHDRFVAWRDRVWCRRCGWSGDAISLARTLWRCQFREAVERLAGVAR